MGAAFILFHKYVAESMCLNQNMKCVLLKSDERQRKKHKQNNKTQTYVFVVLELTTCHAVPTQKQHFFKHLYSRI